MELLGIGAFAKATRLSQRALRLYDELGLLAPARVDPVTGYRGYAPEQLDRARLVAWLRRLGMPLAGIREVCALDAPAAARAVRAYWADVEADTAARRDLAAFLFDHLQGKDPRMSAISTPLGIRYAALSDAGLVRPSNQDTAYAGSRLLAVADGFGPSGAPAGAAAIDVLRRLESAGARGTADFRTAAFRTEAFPPGDGGEAEEAEEAGGAGGLLNLLEDAVEQAALAVRGVAAAEPDPQQVGTTLTAMVWTGSRLALVHIGDSRAYLLRDGAFFQITHDHTMVQAMVDDGRLSPEEAESHPQRALLVRALAGSAGAWEGSSQDAYATAEIRLQEVRAGDRYLLCSDGLSAVVPADAVREVVATVAEPEQAVRDLVALAHRSGAPDNVSCVVADVRELQP